MINYQHQTTQCIPVIVLMVLHISSVITGPDDDEPPTSHNIAPIVGGVVGVVGIGGLSVVLVVVLVCIIKHKKNQGEKKDGMLHSVLSVTIEVKEI